MSDGQAERSAGVAPEVAERFRTFDHYKATPAEMDRLYKDAHEQCPVVHSDEHGGFYFMTKYADVRQAAKDWRTFSSASGVFHPPMPFRIAAIEFDPPDHKWWRDLLVEVTNLANYRSYNDRLNEHIDGLIDGFAGRGTADLVSEYAAILPVVAICEMIGITEREKMDEGKAIGLTLFEAIDNPEDFGREMGNFAAFCLGEVNARRESLRGDFLTRLGTEEVGGRMMTDDEIANLLIAFLVAGHHNTSSAFSSLLRHVTSNPKLRDRLIAEPDLVAKAVEEAVRIDTPQGHFFRTTKTETTTPSGTTIPEGCPVALSYAAANRDEEAFEDAMAFSVDRQKTPHLGFGHGIHTCPGAGLARTELRVGLARLLERLPDIEYTGEPFEMSWSAGSLKMISHLPVVFTPEAPA